MRLIPILLALFLLSGCTTHAWTEGETDWKLPTTEEME